VDRPYQLVFIGGLVADIGQPHLRGGLFRLDHRHPLWHSALQVNKDCLGADRHGSGAGAETTYESF